MLFSGTLIGSKIFPLNLNGISYTYFAWALSFKATLSPRDAPTQKSHIFNYASIKLTISVKLCDLSVIVQPESRVLYTVAGWLTDLQARL